MYARFLTLFIEWLGFYFDGMTAVIGIILYQAQCTWFFANALALSQERLTLSNS